MFVNERARHGGLWRWTLCLAVGLLGPLAAVGSPYSDLTLSHGPVAYWRLGESSGTTAVDVTGTHSGTYQNSVTLGANGAVAGDADMAATFAGGANDRVQVNPFGVSGSGITILAWFKSNGFGDDRFVAKATSTATANTHWALGIGSSTQLKAQIKISGTTREILSSVSTMSTGVWYFVAVTYDGSTMRVYLDGVQVGSAAYAGTVSNDAAVAIGLGNLPSGAGNRAFNGVLDETAIFSSALTAAQISALYSTAGGGLRGHWKLVETSGTTSVDSSVQLNNGTYTNGVILGSNGPYPGAGDKAANFDGSNDYVAIPNESRYDLTGPMAVAAWIKVDVFDDPEQAIVTKGNDAWRLQRDGSNNGVNFYCRNLTTNTVASSVNVNDGRWHHVAGVYTGSQLQIYVDGVLSNSVSSTGTILANNRAVAIGRNIQGAGRQFDGSIHDVRIYSRALSQPEVALLYGLVGHWKFDEAAGAIASDSSGMGNNATINGASWTSDCSGNTALDFDGINDRATTNSNFTPPANGAVAFWMRGSGTSAVRQRLFGINGDWEARLEPTGTISFDLGGSPYVGNEPFASTVVDELDRWYHIVAVFDASTEAYSVYVDGELTASGISPVNLVAQPAGILSFGTRTGSSEYWQGALRGFRIYNRAISTSEIAELAGMIARWQLNESSGTVATDSSVAANNANYVGSPTLGVSSSNSATNGTAVELNGTSQYLSSGKSLLNGLSKFTLAAWMRPDSLTPDKSFLGQNGLIELGIDTQTDLIDLWTSSGGSLSATAQLAASKWSHVVAVGDGLGLRIYVNGVEVGSGGTFTASYGSNTGTFKIGEGVLSSSGTYFDGRFDDVRVYSRALCPEEINAIYQGGRPAGVRIIRWIETR